jgi:hypothetical protein
MRQPPEFDATYLTGFFLEILGLCLLAFSLYLAPHAFLGFIYPLPDTVFEIEWWLDEHHNPAIYHVLIIFLPFFLSGLLCLFEARNLTKRIEKQQLGQEEFSEAEHIKAPVSEGVTSVVRVVLAIGAVFLVFWLITRSLS